MSEVERFKAGDSAHFGKLVREFGPMVLDVARSYARDLDQAEDLFQEIWKRAFEKRDTWDGRGALRAWLHRVATSVCISEYRVRKVRARAFEEFVSQEPDLEVGWRPLDPLAHTERKEFHARLHRALGALSDREHQAVSLLVLEGRPSKEVARIMGTTTATVRSNIRHAVTRLKLLMEDPGDDLSRHRSTH